MSNLNDIRRNAQKHLIQKVDVIHSTTVDNPDKIPSSEVTHEIENTKADEVHNHDADYLKLNQKAVDINDDTNDGKYTTPLFLKNTLAAFLGKAKTITGTWTFRALEIVSSGNTPVYFLLSGASIDAITDIIGGITVTDRTHGKTRQLTFHNDGSIRYAGVKLAVDGDYLEVDGKAEDSKALEGKLPSVNNAADTVVVRDDIGRINITDLVLSKAVESGGVVGDQTVAVVGVDGSLKHYSIAALRTWIGKANATNAGLVKIVNVLGTSEEATLTQKALKDLFDNLQTQYLGTEANAVSATKLKTARKINGKAFDGTTDITTDVWGNARTFTFGDTSKSVDGSSDISFTLNELGAVGNTDDRLSDSREWTGELVSKVEAETGTSEVARKWSSLRVKQAIDKVVVGLDLSQYLPKSGGTLTGSLSLTDLIIKKTIESGGVVGTHSIVLLDEDGNVSHYSHAALKTWIGNATSTNPGLVKLVGELGASTDAAVTQKLLNDVVFGLESTYLGIDDNAVSATKLKTTRTINGANFDGTSNITTSSWGTSRTITIGDKALSVNGSDDVEYTLAAIGAVANGDDRLSNAREWTAGIVSKAEAEGGTSTTARKWTALRVREAIDKVIVGLNLNQYLPKAGGTMTGELALTDLIIKKVIEVGGVIGDHSIVLLNGDGEVVHYSHAALKTWIGNATSTNPGLVKLIGELGNSTDHAVTQKLLNSVISGLETTYLGVNDNAVSATKLKTARTVNGTDFDGTSDIVTNKWGAARTITIGEKAISVNGEANISYTLEQIGAVPNSDDRLTDSREWIAGVVTKAEAEAGTSSNAKKWTALRVREAVNKVVTDLNVEQYFLKSGGELTGHVHSTNKGILPLRTYDVNETGTTIPTGLSVYNVSAEAEIPFEYTAGLTVKVNSNRGWEMGVSDNLGVYVRRLHTGLPNGSSEWEKMFSESHPPTRATVGLGSVNNWSATSSLSDAATNKYATANAIYQLKSLIDTLAGGGEGGFLTETQADELYLGIGTTSKDSERLGGVLPSGYRKIVKKVISVPKDTWQTLFKVGTYANGTVFSFTIQGTSGSTVVSIKADVITLHPGKVVISAINADYTDVVLRVSAAANGIAYVEMLHKGANTANMNVLVDQRDGFAVTFYTNGHIITDAVTAHQKEIYLSGDSSVTSGAINTGGDLNEKGKRVFSPNNRNISDSLTNDSSTIYGSAKANKLLNDLIATNLGKTVRSDVDDYIGAHTRWSDSKEARWGNGNDLRLGHNGTNSYMANYNGNLLIYNHAVGGDMHWYLKGTDNATRIPLSLISSGTTAYVQLKYNGNTKLQTDNYGVVVTGRISATEYYGNLNTANGAQLILNAGDARGKFGGQTAEKVYVNSEGGLEVNTPDSAHPNFETGYSAIKTTITGYAIIVNGNTVWHAGNDGPGSGMNADLLDNYHANVNATANTIALRNGSGDLIMRLARSTFAAQASISGAMAFRVNSTNDNYVRFCSDTAAIRAFLSLYSKTEQDSRYLKTTAKAADSNKLDNIDSSQFLRSDATDTKTGVLQMQDNAAVKLGSGGDVEHFFNGTHYYTDLNVGMNWYLRDGNSSNANRFTFDIDTGNLTCTGNVTAYNSSDIKLKSELTDFDNPLGVVGEFRTGAYLKQDPSNLELTHWEIGLIANDIEKWCPSMVNTDQYGYLNIKDGGNELHSLAFSCIKELTKLNDEKSKVISDLLLRVEALENNL